MKAWRIEKHGGPEVLQYLDISTPNPNALEARIRVQAVGLNHMDLWVRNGVSGHRFPLPLTPGCDVAGEIDEIGSEAARRALAANGLAVGSAVVLNPGVSCGCCEACLSGFDPICPHYGLLGETRDGGCADFVVVPITSIVPRPTGVSAEEAAALPVAAVTAWSMLTRKAALKAGETVLIQAGGSGVSIYAIQLAKLLGAIVITTVGSAEKAAQAKTLGADYVINYKEKPFREEVKKIQTERDKKGVEIVIDHVGGETFKESLKCLAWGGRLVTCGATADAKVEIDLRHVFFKNISIFGSTIGSRSDLIRIMQLVEAHKIRPVIDSMFSMDQYPQAVARLESRDFFGKIVVRSSS